MLPLDQPRRVPLPYRRMLLFLTTLKSAIFWLGCRSWFQPWSEECLATSSQLWTQKIMLIDEVGWSSRMTKEPLRWDFAPFAK
jgi:hypothetical protein